MTTRPDSLDAFIRTLQRLPGIGPKAAERIAYHLLGQSPAELKQFAGMVERLADEVVRCTVCGTFDATSPCTICRDTKRDARLLCVVATPMDIRAIEQTNEFRGRYHVLGGLLNPLEGVTPNDLGITNLIKRVEESAGKIGEVILALNPTVEGEATALYLDKALRQFKVKITKLARGLPLGAELEYADEMTLADALRGRREA